LAELLEVIWPDSKSAQKLRPRIPMKLREPWGSIFFISFTGSKMRDDILFEALCCCQNASAKMQVFNAQVRKGDFVI
jgi:hypothetical protein